MDPFSIDANQSPAHTACDDEAKLRRAQGAVMVVDAERSRELAVSTDLSEPMKKLAISKSFLSALSLKINQDDQLDTSEVLDLVQAISPPAKTTASTIAAFKKRSKPRLQSGNAVADKNKGKPKDLYRDDSMALVGKRIRRRTPPPPSNQEASKKEEDALWS